jgi:hypothetical protein
MAIENAREYEVCKQTIGFLEEMLQDLKNEPPKHIHIRLIEASEESTQVLIDELKQELAEYEAQQRQVE